MAKSDVKPENPDTTHYLIIRSCLWFAKDDRIKIDLFKEYYTPKAIKSLIDYGFIKIIFK